MNFSALIVGVLVTIQLAPAAECIKFKSGERLVNGQSYVHALPRGLELRLVAEGVWGWRINVVEPSSPDTDYMWVVSPPYQTAPQRQIGPGYGLTAHQSASFQRELNFVLSAGDHKVMFELLAERPRDTARIVQARQRLKKGTLLLKVTNFAVREEYLDWMTFEGEACVPK